MGRANDPAPLERVCFLASASSSTPFERPDIPPPSSVLSMFRFIALVALLSTGTLSLLFLPPHFPPLLLTRVSLTLSSHRRARTNLPQPHPSSPQRLPLARRRWVLHRPLEASIANDRAEWPRGPSYEGTCRVEGQRQHLLRSVRALGVKDYGAFGFFLSSRRWC